MLFREAACPVNLEIAGGSSPVEPAIFSDSYKMAASAASVTLPKTLAETQWCETL